MQSIRQIERLNATELEKVIPPEGSWHRDYADSAYIYIGGLPFELSEGDILTIFSQYGNPVHINLVRDKETGKSKGFCFLKYEDQRSCDLAVDNLSGAGVMGRVLSVDHTRYKKKEGEVEGIGEEEDELADDDTDAEGEGREKRRKTESESEEERPMIKEEIELAKLLREHDDDDPMKAFLVKEKREEVAEALKAVVKRKSKDGDRERRHRHHHRSRRHDDENGEGRREHRSRRNDEDGHRSHRSRRERSRTPDSDREEGRRSHKSRRDRSRDRDDRKSRRNDSAPPSDDEERPKRRRERDADRKRSEDERSQSREPYRRR